MKDLIAKLQMDANCALGAIWMHIDAQAARIAELEAQQAFGIGETYANALSRIAELEAQIADKADTDIPEALELLAAVFDAWENGDDCYEDPEECAGFLGKAFRLDDDIFNRCVELLNRRNPPRNAASTALQAPVREVPEGMPVSQEPKYGIRDNRLFNRASGEFIPEDEPVFIFRARDTHAVNILAGYAREVLNAEHASAVWSRVDDFKRFWDANPDRMKQPDTALPAAPVQEPKP